MRILAVGAHPDDVEFGCAPLLIQEARRGHHVKVLIASKGEAASSGTPEERAQEAREAAKLIGADVDFLDFGGDCRIEHTPANALVLAREIRAYQPWMVLAPSLEENQHPDHSAVGRMVRDASRLARYGGLEGLKDFPPHAVGHLFFYNITQGFPPPPDLIVDVTAVHETWEAAMKCHKTQMRTRSYLDLVNARAKALGSAIGVDYAVGLWVNDPIRLDGLSDLTRSSRHY